eukprot:TRINITY_DN2864_c0_g1_i3.p1 TRINITY_DN2864_c0_g1~~TRINITY_DN2864_c0_g1_i3.p1  ORF type:complete len:218 (+),score=53.71 TRINITY_DN2864_c0_g1_i3:63-656(+)
MPNVNYCVLPAEASDEDLVKAGLVPGTVDLVCVAQALHYFNFETFHETVFKVLKPQGGLYVAITYVLPVIAKDLDELMYTYMEDILGPHWNPNRLWTLDGYAKVPLGPLAEYEVKNCSDLLPDDAKRIVLQWDFNDLVGYTDSWSGVQNYIKTEGKHPLKDNEELFSKFQAAWPGPLDQKVECIYPLLFKMAKLERN